MIPASSPTGALSAVPTGPTAVDPLAALRDLHLPDAVGWWPPAPGWWGLALLLTALLIVAGYLIRRHLRRNRYRRLALQELNRLFIDYRQTQDRARLLQQLSQLLRRTALVAFPHAEVAKLSGDDWQRFLADSSAIEAFVEQPGQMLSQGCYQPDPACEPQLLHRLCKGWLRRHRLSTWRKARGNRGSNIIAGAGHGKGQTSVSGFERRLPEQEGSC